MPKVQAARGTAFELGLGVRTIGTSGVSELPESPRHLPALCSSLSTTISGVDTRIKGIWLSRREGLGRFSALVRCDRDAPSSAVSSSSEPNPRSLSSRPSGSPARAPASGIWSIGRVFLRSGSFDRTRLLEVCSRISAIKSSMLYHPTELYAIARHHPARSSVPM